MRLTPFPVIAAVLAVLLGIGLGYLLHAERSAGAAEVVEAETRDILDAAFAIQALVPEVMEGSARARAQLELVQGRVADALAGLRVPLAQSAGRRWLESGFLATQDLQRRLVAAESPLVAADLRGRLGVHLHELTSTAGTLHADAVSHRARAAAHARWAAVAFLGVAFAGLGLLIVHHYRGERQRARHDRQLADANRELRAYADDLEQYVYAASHDLKEPLRMVSQFLDLLRLRLGALEQPSAGYLERAMSGAARMHRLLDDLLRITILDHGRPPAETFAAAQAVEEVVETLAAPLQAAAGEVSVDPLPTVVGDRTGFGQVVQNLVLNALKYRDPARPPRVSIRVEESVSEWVFAIADNGIGFDMAHAEAIFRLFKRLHGRDIEGTGAGLAICRKIVTRWRGRIWAESTPGVGSTFRFFIPKPDGTPP
jgi:signal transduction histidine kinase